MNVFIVYIKRTVGLLIGSGYASKGTDGIIVGSPISQASS